MGKLGAGGRSGEGAGEHAGRRLEIFHTGDRVQSASSTITDVLDPNDTTSVPNPDLIAALVGDETPDLPGVPLQPPSMTERVASISAIVLPFLGLIAAIIYTWNNPFSWLNLSLFVGGYLLTSFGITVGFHRLFTHKSFKAHPIVTATTGILGSMTVEGPLLFWVATHRRHHQHTDRPEDPHSPHFHGEGMAGFWKGLLHSHMGWFFAKSPSREFMERYVPDLQADPMVVWISKMFPVWVLISALVPAGIALAVTGTWMGALMGLVWGGLLRVFFVHHVTWSINSVCHIWGSQPMNTHDESRNNAIFGILAMGEGWHNNHHAFPASAKHGLEWWQFDMSYILIRAMAMVGLASNIKKPTPDRIEAKRKRADAPSAAS